jgi:hypothetical protein
MLSAARYPIVLFGPLRLPPILPQSAAVYAVLRKVHTVLAYLLFGTFFAHLTAVLFHALVLRDGILNRMALWKSGASRKPQAIHSIPAAVQKNDVVPTTTKEALHSPVDELPDDKTELASAANLNGPPLDEEALAGGRAKPLDEYKRERGL